MTLTHIDGTTYASGVEVVNVVGNTTDAFHSFPGQLQERILSFRKKAVEADFDNPPFHEMWQLYLIEVPVNGLTVHWRCRGFTTYLDEQGRLGLRYDYRKSAGTAAWEQREFLPPEYLDAVIKHVQNGGPA
jgi:hypothetical protein